MQNTTHQLAKLIKSSFDGLLLTHFRQSNKINSAISLYLPTITLTREKNYIRKIQDNKVYKAKFIYNNTNRQKVNYNGIKLQGR